MRPFRFWYFFSIKENKSDFLGGLLEAILSVDLKELNVIRIEADQNTVAHVSLIKKHYKNLCQIGNRKLKYD